MSFIKDEMTRLVYNWLYSVVYIFLYNLFEKQLRSMYIVYKVIAKYENPSKRPFVIYSFFLFYEGTLLFVLYIFQGCS